ncbi:MocR-like pyridoxine biosynthesis transcription factor PdxR [Oceanobacillus jeddahense]|uniref:PLP-dependent aminotransferase family protein n=1 Tax=Oceanobacillus jeddahense TaxID=1462527 RepID=A0ABY5JY26_9BACI|nr:PLP-dependent aminotransferase family protein [Oceanobacillus jeddahense]UUI03459.1 PLP-dependent aminotransferase family protein [Oceanobacillus jeddahense]
MKKPKYQIIIDFIKEKISKGEWAIGSQIPSQRHLAKMFGVNRSTIITALEELMADGLIEGIAGKGTVVTNNTWTLMGNHFSTNWNRNVTQGIHKPSVSTVQEINEAESDNRFIQLSKGELSPELFPLKEMQEIIQKVSNQLTPFGYEEPKGNRKLRQTISSYLKERGVRVSPPSILVVSGALQALHLISIGLLKEKSTVFLEEPSYLYSLSVFQSAGMDLDGLPMDNKGVKVDSIFQTKETGRNILYTIPTFHNPTGILMEESRREELMEYCIREQIPVIEDDVYRDLWMDNVPPEPLKARDRHGNVLYIGSLSKTLSPGLRIGWIVGPESVIDRLADLKMQLDYGSSTLSQLTAEMWLSSGMYEHHLENVRKQLRIRRKKAIDTLDKYLGFYATWDIPEGGFFIWIKINYSFKVKKLFEKALSKGIVINPGSIYKEQTGQFIRLSYGFASLDEIEKGIFELSEIIKNNKVELKY